MPRVLISMLVLVIAATAGCRASRRDDQSPPKAARDLAAEAAALQLSQTCSTAAEAFWRRGGFDHPTKPAAGTTENWSYQSHYNTQQKRCLIRVDLVLLLRSGGSAQTREVFDAIEGGEPLASMNVHRIGPGSDPTVALVKATGSIPATPENLDWFHGLMSR